MKRCGIGLSLCLMASAFAADISVVDEIIAKVNGDIVTRSELDKGYRQIEADLRRANETGAVLQKDLTEKSKGILADRIDSLLLISKGKELNINVDAEVSKYMANLRRGPQIVDDDKFHAYIREQTGQSYEDFLLDMKNSLLRQRVIGACDRGEPTKVVARTFGVSPAWVRRLKQHRRERGDIRNTALFTIYKNIHREFILS